MRSPPTQECGKGTTGRIPRRRWLFCSLAARQAHPRMSSHRQAGERDKAGKVVSRCIVTIGLV
jgi:hypothetical protein